MNSTNHACITDISSIMRKHYEVSIAQKRKNESLTPIINSTISTLKTEIYKIEKERQQTVSHLLVAFDHEGKNFRHHLHKGYKKSRKPMPPEYIMLVDRIQKILTEQGICCVRKPNIEADDAIASAVNIFESIGFYTTIQTRDKDCFSLISEKTSIYSGTDKKMFTLENMHERLPVPPSKVADYLAMVGDGADSIDGIPGFGKKSAIPVLDKYSIDQIINNPDLLFNLELRGKKKFAKWIHQNKHILQMYYYLCMLNNETPLGVTLKQMQYNKDML